MYRSRTSCLVLAVLPISLAWLAGCPQAAPTASFTAGSGGSDFGTIEDGKGNTFQVTQIGDGFGVTANGSAGNAVYEVDGDGRLTHIETERLTADFVYNADGSASVSGSLTVQNETRVFDGVIPADNSTTKVRMRAQGSGSVCRAVDFFCTNLDAILLYVEAALLREGGYQDNPENDPGINIANSFIQAAVTQAMERVTGPAQAFCAVWPEIRGELGELCP